MIRVMVVEDEPLILRSIKQMIEETHHCFKVVSEAYDGEEALQIIQVDEPDIVFTDIKMPVMDGLKLIEELQKNYKHIFPVILSGYQDFNYAKKAIKLGVVEYLLKPLSLDALEVLLNILYNRFEVTKKEQQFNFLNKLVYKNLMSPENGTKNLRSFDYKEFSYILLCAGSYCIYPSKLLSSGKEFWIKYCLEDILKKYFDSSVNYWILDGENDNERLIILASYTDLKDPIENAFKSIYADLLDRDTPITLVLGYITEKIFDLSFYIQQSRVILNKNIIFGKSQIILEKHTENSYEYSDHTFDSNAERVLAVYIQNGQIELYKSEMHSLLKAAKEKSYSQLRLESLLKCMVRMFTGSMLFISENKLSDLDMEINELISCSSDYVSLFDGMCFVISELFQSKKLQHDEGDNQKLLTDRIEQFIFSNYTRQISLQSLSDSFGLVPSYLSRVFKKHKGLSPSDFTVKLRIEKAKELLAKNQTLLFKDIAEAVGYDDPYYFSRVFKMMNGCSPSEYRLAARKFKETLGI